MPGVRNADRVVLIAIAICIPTIMQTFSGGLGIASAFGRFAIAIVLCWAAGAILERLIDNYSRQARQAELAKRLQQIAAARVDAAAHDERTVHPTANAAHRLSN